MAVPLNINQVAAREGVRLVVTCVGRDLTLIDVAGDHLYLERARSILGSMEFFERVRAEVGDLVHVGQSDDDRRAVIVMHKGTNVTRNIKRTIASLVSGLKDAAMAGAL